MKELLAVLVALCIIELYIIVVLFNTRSVRLKIAYPRPVTVVRTIDLPEEIDLISSNKNKPDTLTGYRHLDTLFIGYK